MSNNQLSGYDLYCIIGQLMDRIKLLRDVEAENQDEIASLTQDLEKYRNVQLIIT